MEHPHIDPSEWLEQQKAVRLNSPRTAPTPHPLFLLSIQTHFSAVIPLVASISLSSLSPTPAHSRPVVRRSAILYRSSPLHHPGKQNTPLFYSPLSAARLLCIDISSSIQSNPPDPSTHPSLNRRCHTSVLCIRQPSLHIRSPHNPSTWNNQSHIPLCPLQPILARPSTLTILATSLVSSLVLSHNNTPFLRIPPACKVMDV